MQIVIGVTTLRPEKESIYMRNGMTVPPFCWLLYSPSLASDLPTNKKVHAASKFYHAVNISNIMVNCDRSKRGVEGINL